MPIKGQLADVIPWYGQIGGGKQMKFIFDDTKVGGASFQNLIDEGFIKITIKDSPNGAYSKYKGTVISK